jgi:hypothetical protein
MKGRVREELGWNGAPDFRDISEGFFVDKPYI